MNEMGRKKESTPGENLAKQIVEQSDYIISYINRDHGGAYTAVSYAKKKKLPIINLGSFEI